MSEPPRIDAADRVTAPSEGSAGKRLLTMLGSIVVSGLILIGISQAQKTSVGETPAPIEELRAIAVDSPPPPPPPPESPAEPLPPESLDIEPLPTESLIQVVATIAPPAPPMPRLPEIRFDANMDELRPSDLSRRHDGDRLFQVSEVERRPTVLYREPPKYLASALEGMTNPSVTLMFVVTATGVAEEIRVVDAPTQDLGQIMVESVRAWKFRPALREGRPVRCLVRQSVFLVAPNRRPF